MIILLTLACLIAVCWLILKNVGHFSDANTTASLVCFVSSLALFIALITIPLARLDAHANLQRIQAIAETAATARDNKLTLESATLTLQISEANQWLASAKYYNGTLFDIWIPDAVMNAQPIK